MVDISGTEGPVGRWIFVPFVQKGQGIVRPITARPMTDGEKRLYRKKRGKR